jgi:tRNA (guanosine-2'-O-)-methyltransferase
VTRPAACLPLPFVLLACGPASSAKPPETPKLEATNLSPPAGTTLVQACTPTGPELCFNAVDDNCNGVIDEGCGLQTGLLQFTIAWSAPTADVNLGLMTPAHDHVAKGTPASGGFHLDRDCPSDDKCNGQNVENISFEGTEAPPGRYAVEITLVEPHGATLPVRVRFGARLGVRTVGFDVDLGTADDAKKTFSFDVR